MDKKDPVFNSNDADLYFFKNLLLQQIAQISLGHYKGKIPNCAPSKMRQTLADKIRKLGYGCDVHELDKYLVTSSCT